VKQSLIEYHGICFDCGKRHDRKRAGPDDGVITMTPGHCDWCGQDGVPVAAPSDYGYPPLPAKGPD
jgi:hypothetical protein